MNLGPKRAFKIPRIIYHSHHVHVQKGWQNNVKGLSLLKSNSFIQGILVVLIVLDLEIA